MYRINDTTIYNIDGLDNLQFAELNFEEYPKFESTIIVGATYEGFEMDREQLEELNADKYLLMTLVLNYISQLNP